jgi:hypothetical protein
MALPQSKSREEHQESIYTDARKAVRLNGIKARSTICGDQLGRSKQIKAKGRGKGGWQPVQRDNQLGGVRWTSIACQTLAPGETPMRALRSGQYFLASTQGLLMARAE